MYAVLFLLLVFGIESSTSTLDIHQYVTDENDYTMAIYWHTDLVYMAINTSTIKSAFPELTRMIDPLLGIFMQFTTEHIHGKIINLYQCYFKDNRLDGYYANTMTLDRIPVSQHSDHGKALWNICQAFPHIVQDTDLMKPLKPVKPNITITGPLKLSSGIGYQCTATGFYPFHLPIECRPNNLDPHTVSYVHAIPVFGTALYSVDIRIQIFNVSEGLRIDCYPNLRSMPERPPVLFQNQIYNQTHFHIPFPTQYLLIAEYYDSKFIHVAMFMNGIEIFPNCALWSNQINQYVRELFYNVTRNMYKKPIVPAPLGNNLAHALMYDLTSGELVWRRLTYNNVAINSSDPNKAEHDLLVTLIRYLLESDGLVVNHAPVKLTPHSTTKRLTNKYARHYCCVTEVYPPNVTLYAQVNGRTMIPDGIISLMPVDDGGFTACIYHEFVLAELDSILCVLENSDTKLFSVADVAGPRICDDEVVPTDPDVFYTRPSLFEPKRKLKPINMRRLKPDLKPGCTCILITIVFAWLLFVCFIMFCKCGRHAKSRKIK